MDFILKWQENLKDIPTSGLTIKIHNELELLKVINQANYNTMIKYSIFNTNVLLIGIFALH